MRDEPSLQPQLDGLTAGSMTAAAAMSGSMARGHASARDAYRFYIWLLAAIIVHGAVLTGFISSKPRQIGDPSGVDGAISISLVTEADLRGDATVADSAPGNPAPPPALPTPPPQPPAAEAPEPSTQPPLPDPPPRLSKPRSRHRPNLS